MYREAYRPPAELFNYQYQTTLLDPPNLSLPRKQVVDRLVDNPPTVAVVDSTNPNITTLLRPEILVQPPLFNDLFLAREINRLLDADQIEPDFQYPFWVIATYLSCPYVVDSFTDHSCQRRPWRDTLIDYTNNIWPINNPIADFFKNNRLSGNRISTYLYAIKLITKPDSFEDHLINKLTDQVHTNTKPEGLSIEALKPIETNCQAIVTDMLRLQQTSFRQLFA